MRQIVNHIIQRIILLRIWARHAFLSDPYFCRRAPENGQASSARAGGPGEEPRSVTGGSRLRKVMHH
eukprot:5904375-Pleurochrysis_carterae.AAC.1